MPRLLLALLAVLVPAAPAHAAFGPVGTLHQVTGPDACIDESGSEPCRDGRAMGTFTNVAMSPDGSSMLVLNQADTVAVLRRDPGTGALTQPATTAGCVAPTGNSLNCREAKNLDGAHDAAFSPDGRHVYVAGDYGIAAFDYVNDAAIGGLIPLPGAAACYSIDGRAQPDGVDAACTDGRALLDVRSIAVSPDGAFVYAVTDPSDTSWDGIVILARDKTSGALTQAAGAAGCITTTRYTAGDGGSPTGCGGELRAASNPSDLAVAHDGAALYVATDDGVIALRRDAQGVWNQLTTEAGCVTSVPRPACADGRALDEPHALALVDAGTIFVTNDGLPEVAVIHTNRFGLSQTADADGCYARDGNPNDGPASSCLVAHSLGGFKPGVGASPDHVTVAIGGGYPNGEVALFERGPDGAIRQGDEKRGCVSRDGNASGLPDGGGAGVCTVAAGSGNAAFAWSPGSEHFYAGGGTSIAALQREVAPRCDAPTATTQSPNPVTLAFNCTDLNGDEVTLSLTVPSLSGTSALDGPRTVRYTPNPGFSGRDWVTVRPRDASGNEAAEVVTFVDVTPAPKVTPGPGGKAPLPRAVTRTLRRDRRGRMRFSLACPASATVACKGRLVIKTMKVRTSRRGKRRVITVTSRNYDIAPGKRARLTFRATAAVRRVLKARRLTGLNGRLTAPAQGTLTAATARFRAQLKR